MTTGLKQDPATVLKGIGVRLQERANAAQRRGAADPSIDALRALSKELSSGGGRLAGTDLVRAYPPETLLPALQQSPSTSFVRLFEVARDALVFLPVALTWWQLHQALSAYERGPSDVPFLLGWQRGFDGATWPLSSSALLVAVIVMIIIGLTLLVHFADARITSERFLQPEREKLAQDLVLATVLLTCQDHPPVDRATVRQLSRLSGQVASASVQLATALSDASGAIARAVDAGPGSNLHKALSEWISAAQELRRVSESLEAPKETLRALTQLHQAVVADGEQMRSRLAALVEELERGARAHVNEAQSNRVVADEVNKSVQTLGESLHAFNRHAEQLSELVLQLRYALERLDGSYRDWGHEPIGIGNAEPLDGPPQ